MTTTQFHPHGRPALSAELRRIQVSITRPNDTLPYAQRDTISDHATDPTAAGYYTLPVTDLAGGAAIIRRATMWKSVTNVTNAAFGVLLFDTLPALAGIDDNVACAITDAEFERCVGVLRFLTGTAWTEVVQGDVQVLTPSLYVKCLEGDTNLYGVLLAEAGYTPAANTKFQLDLLVEVLR